MNADIYRQLKSYIPQHQTPGISAQTRPLLAQFVHAQTSYHSIVRRVPKPPNGRRFPGIPTDDVSVVASADNHGGTS